MPKGMASSTETTVAARASSRDRGRRRSSSSMTGCPVQSELPKSRRSTPHSHVPNCTTKGWSSPSRWRMSASCLGSMLPAWSPPKISRATSPGMTRMITNTRAAAPSKVGTIRRSRFAMYVLNSIRGQPDVLELLIGVVIGRRHVVLHLGPVHHAPPPPEAGDVVRVIEHDLLDLVDEPFALGRVEDPGLARVEVVDPGVGESTPVVGVPRGVPLEKQIGVVDVVEHAADDQLEAPRIASIREPGRRLQRPVLGLDADLAPLLDREHREVLVGNLHVAVFQDDLEAVGVTRLGQEAPGLGPVLVHVLPEPRQLLEL